MIIKILTTAITFFVAATALAYPVYAPISEDEKLRCERDFQWAKMIRECQSQRESAACYVLYNEVRAAASGGALKPRFSPMFDGLDSTYQEYLQAMRDQFWQDMGRYPLRITISAALWAVDLFMIYVFWANPQFVVAAHAAGWTISLLMWGNEGGRLLNPCMGLTADAGEDRLRLCRYAIKERIKDFKKLNYSPKLPSGFLEKTAEENSVLSYRLACAMTEQMRLAYTARFEEVGCEEGKVYVGPTGFDVQPDGSLLKQDQWFEGRIHHGEFVLSKRKTPYQHLPGPAVDPVWSVGVNRLVQLYYPRILETAASCR